MREPRIFEKEAWGDLIKTPEWKYFLELVKEHTKYLNRQTCISIRTGKIEEAIKYQAKAEDWERIIFLIDNRIREVSKGGDE